MVKKGEAGLPGRRGGGGEGNVWSMITAPACRLTNQAVAIIKENKKNKKKTLPSNPRGLVEIDVNRVINSDENPITSRNSERKQL